MNKTDPFVQDVSHWSKAISNVATITIIYHRAIHIAIDKLDFCSQLMVFIQFGVLFMMVAIVGIAN